MAQSLGNTTKQEVGPSFANQQISCIITNYTSNKAFKTLTHLNIIIHIN